VKPVATSWPTVTTGADGVLPGGGDGGGQVISGGRGTQLAAEATALVDPRATTRVDMAITHRGIVRVAMGADPM
jgi:hypothetical protein